MNGIEKITARIQEDAKADCAALLREAMDRAGAIQAKYEEQARTETAAAAEKAKSAAVARLERLESAAQMDAKKLLLGAKQACIEEAFAQAQADLLALPEGEYVSLLARIAVKASQTGREELIFSPKDREKVGAKVVAEANRLRSGAPAPEKADGTLKGALKEVGSAVAAAASQIKTGTAFTLASDTREMAGGVILRDGSIEINCAFETQLRLLRDSMAGEVAGILFS